ncbi:MAG TPA: alanine--glyoxylate aminotransferase family protein [Candidatus Eisenbacteria bacterium]|nr:alanine--glyoxylate aminotransferase family protein [Candidatus Eisenbacteria bacterium]
MTAPPTAARPAAVAAATRPRLFTPGPVEIPVRILRALSQTPPHHRTDAFRATFLQVSEDLKWLHQTQGEVLMLAASGTGAMEAAVVNLMPPGRRALCVVGGKFGERWANLCKAYAIPFQTLDVPWGRAVDPADVERALDADPAIAVVFATHSETSTGTLHDAQALARATRARERRLVLDAITSLGVHPLPQDEWGVDVVVTGSQKGLMSPPGIATVSLAPWALDAIEGERAPRFYWDLRKARKSLPAGESAFTPAVSLVFAVGEALTMMREEGLAAVHRRHARLGAAVRAGAQALGFTLFSHQPANSLTALEPPAGVEAGAVVKRLREVHGIVVAGGQDHMKGRMLRIGHMGAYDLGDVHVILGALEECVGALGRPAAGAAAAARAAWDAA